MKSVYLFFWVLSLISGIWVNRYPDSSSSFEPLSKVQTDLIQKVLSEFPENSEMAFALIHGSKIDYYGLKRIYGKNEKVENATSVFEIGSITKVFTTHLLLNLLNDGKIASLDESIPSYWDFPFRGNPDFTFYQLANHTSGLPSNLSGSFFNTDVSNPYKNWDNEKFRKYFEKELKLESKPGEAYRYSNIGMALLANTVCKIRQEDYETLLQREIFLPLKMNSSSSNRDLLKEKLVQAYNWKGKPTANWDLEEMRGAGSVLSTVNDLSKYLNWNFEALNSQLELMKLPSKEINETIDIALGWHIVKNQTKMPFLWHNGGTGGYKSSMALNLFNQTGIVILTNIGATDNPKKALIDQLCYDLMRTLEE